MTVRVKSGDNAEIMLGGTWTLNICSDEEPTVTVTLPDTTSTAATVELGSLYYVATLAVSQEGRHTALIDDGTDIVGASAYVVGAPADAPLPTIEDVRDYLVSSSFTDEQLQQKLDAETVAQRRVCRIPATYPADLFQALVRRVARALSVARSLGDNEIDGETGRNIAPRTLDAEIRRLEAPYRKLPVG